MSKIKSYILAALSIIITIVGLTLVFSLNEFFKVVVVSNNEVIKEYPVRIIDINLVGAVFISISSLFSILSAIVLVIPKLQKYRPYIFIASFVSALICAITIVCLKLFSFKFDSLEDPTGAATRFGAACWISLSTFLISRSIQIILALKIKKEN